MAESEHQGSISERMIELNLVILGMIYWSGCILGLHNLVASGLGYCIVGRSWQLQYVRDYERYLMIFKEFRHISHRISM